MYKRQSPPRANADIAAGDRDGIGASCVLCRQHQVICCAVIDNAGADASRGVIDCRAHVGQGRVGGEVYIHGCARANLDAERTGVGRNGDAGLANLLCGGENDVVQGVRCLLYTSRCV